MTSGFARHHEGLGISRRALVYKLQRFRSEGYAVD